MEPIITIDEKLSKEDKYKLLIKQVEAFLKDENDLIANMANVAALIHTSFGFHWVGFYRVIDQDLVLGPFQGPVACTRIKIPKGVCGTCVDQKKTIVVEDVHSFPGHIACSALSNSEIVLPFIENDTVKWILDIDSIEFNDFNQVDCLNLERIIDLF